LYQPSSFMPVPPQQAYLPAPNDLDGSVAGEKGLGLEGSASVGFDTQAIEGGRASFPKGAAAGRWITI
jgi:hypothetical protein